MQWLLQQRETEASFVHIIVTQTQRDKKDVDAIVQGQSVSYYFDSYVSWLVGSHGSVAESLACWTQTQNGPGSNRSRDAVG